MFKENLTGIPARLGMVDLGRRAATIAILALVATLAIPAMRVEGATYSVNSLNDPGTGGCDATECTLREAIEAANSNPGVDVITFSVSGTIALSSPLPQITEAVTLDGATAPGEVVIDGQGAVASGLVITVWWGQTIVRNLTLRGFTGEAILVTLAKDEVILANLTVYDSYVGIFSARYGWAPQDFGNLTIFGVNVTADTACVAIRSSNVTVRDSLLHNCGTYGVLVGNDMVGGEITGPAVERAEILECGLSGVFLYGADLYGLEVRNSTVAGSGVWGIALADNGTGTVGRGLIVGNLIVHNGVTAPGGGVLLMGAVEGMEIFGNNISLNGYDQSGLPRSFSPGIALVTNSTSGRGPFANYIGLDRTDSARDGNLVLNNSAEGILLAGSSTEGNVVAYNMVGVDASGLAWGNGDGGVTLAAGAHDNVVRNNTLGYNAWQDLAIEGQGSDGNEVLYNYILADPVNMSLGIIITGGASRNLVARNVVRGHAYEGIFVNGTGTDWNNVSRNWVGAFDRWGNYLADRSLGNGAGIAVACDAAPKIHYPFPVNGSSAQGPDSTLLQGNRVAGNRGAGVILIGTTNFVLNASNEVWDNELWGVYWVGSSGNVSGNSIHDNDLDGVRVEPYYGESSHPDDHADDVLSLGLGFGGMGISGNVIQDNGGLGLYVLDNPWANLSWVVGNNTVSGNGLGQAALDWLGYVQVRDSGGGAVLGLTVEIFRGGDDGDDVADYASGAWDSAGRYGPPDFDYENISTWWRVREVEINSSGTYRYNPHSFTLNGFVRPPEVYSWDGEFDPASESGGAWESPPGSGADRYQYALVSYGSPSPHRGEVVINEVLYNECGAGLTASTNDEFIEIYFSSSVDVSGWTLTDGSESPGNFEFTFPPGSVFSAGSYAVVWLGDPGVGSAPSAANFYVGTRARLRNVGDDIWLFDSSGLLVDYVAYGSDGGIEDPPPGALFWAGPNSPGGAGDAWSLALTPNGVFTTSGADWELSTSDTAPGPPTVDTDSRLCGADPYVTSVGVNNNGPPPGPAVGGLYVETSRPALLFVSAVAAALAAALLLAAALRGR